MTFHLENLKLIDEEISDNVLLFYARNIIIGSFNIDPYDQPAVKETLTENYLIKNPKYF